MSSGFDLCSCLDFSGCLNLSAFLDFSVCFEFFAMSIKLSELILRIVFCDKSPRSFSEGGDRFVVPRYLRGGTWYKRRWNHYEV